MKYIEFRDLMREFTVFSIADIRQCDAGFHRRRLNEWQEKGYIKKVIKGYYIFTDMPINENILFEIANRIYPPSYISFEMALSYHGLIPESVYGITSASTRKTMRFKTNIGEFSYHTIRPKLYFGFECPTKNGRCHKIASPEKAILDYFYIHPELKSRSDFESIRVNRETFLEKVDLKKLLAYAGCYTKESFKKRISIFLEYIKHARA